MINWQLIETAPLDGTDVLVYDGYDIWKAYYEVDRGWIESSFDWCNEQDLFHKPTHWLPISDLLQLLGHL